jgi:hypothetical protein
MAFGAHLIRECAALLQVALRLNLRGRNRGSDDQEAQIR